MKYRRFGRTEIQMPVLTCGGMRYQHSWGDEQTDAIPSASQANVEATIHRALELGMNHIETARGYGTSEIQLGQILPTLPREKIIVQTKVGPSDDPQVFLETFEKSMRYLRLDYVDLLAFHGINDAETLNQTVRKGGCLEVARQLQREGRVRHLGFATHGPSDVVQQAVETGEFDYVNLHWYFVNEFNRPAIDAATRLDMGVFIISPNDKGGKLYEPTQVMSDLCAPLTPMQFNLLYCLANPQIHTLSIGAAHPGDFDQHIAALDYYDRAAEVAYPIAQKLRGEMARRLGADWVEGWWQGIPRWQDAPGHINLHEILRLWTWAKGLDLVEFGKMRYNLMGQGGHWFPGQNAAALGKKEGDQKGDGQKNNEQTIGGAVISGQTISDQAIIESLKANPFAKEIPNILREAHQLLFEAPVKRLSES